MKTKKTNSIKELSYRSPMQVTEVLLHNSTPDNWKYNSCSGYPICPRCKTSMERDYQSFCDRCGQKLCWKNYKNAKIKFAGDKSGKTYTYIINKNKK